MYIAMFSQVKREGKDHGNQAGMHVPKLLSSATARQGEARVLHGLRLRAVRL